MGSIPGAPVGASITLPTSTDLTVGKGNLDRFVERRIEEFSNELTTPTIMEDEERVDSHGHTQNGGSSQLLGTTDSGKGGDDPVLRRPGIQAIDEKGQMIKHQNNANDFDGYVVKVVRNNVENDRKKREAAVDMAFEAKLMSALAHPNIISIRGVLGYIENPNHYGLIMDKLRSTLQGQIQEWAKASSEDSVSTACPENNPLLGHIPQWMLLTKHEKDKQRQYFRQTAFFVERLEALLDVAKAMRYLHEKKIVFRDLKPENVGLTLENYVLFDFGLSRELTDKDRVGDAEDEYHATGLTGSRLFMAPEVALKKPYGFSADIFSFAILFWEVASLKEVFPNLTMNKHFKQVIVRGKRPASLKDTLPANLNEMMEAAWDKNPSNRPTSESICETLTKSLEKRLSQTTSTMLRDFSWKSTESGPKSWRPNESSHGSAKTKKNLGQQLEHALDKFHMPTNKFWTSERHVNTHSNGVHRQNRTSL
jgi:serine/threonine protein kinase